MSHLVSPRGHFLLLRNIPRDGERPTITVECYEKWYTLFLVYRIHHELAIDELEFPDYPEGTPYIDHVPNPRAVRAFAEKMGYNICELSYEMMIGRWHLASCEGALDSFWEDGHLPGPLL